MKILCRILKQLGVVALVGLIAFLIFAPGIVENGRNAVKSDTKWPVSDRARALHDTMVIGDWHADTLLWKRNMLDRASRGHVDLQRLQEGNVALQMFTAVTKSPAGQNYAENATDARDNITLLAIGQLWPPRTWNSLLERALYQAERLHQAAAASDGQLRVITSRAALDDLLSARAEGARVVGGLLGIEGAHALEANPKNLDRLEAAGYRMIALHHFFDNALGGSLHGTDSLGLTPFGRKVVQAIEERGLILDVAHSSPQVVRDVLAMTNMPIVISHTGIASQCRTPRNIPDDLMQGVAGTGGLIAIGYWADVTCDDTPNGVAASIVAAVTLVGADHVGPGSDFDGSVTTGFDASQLPALTSAMLDAGLNEEQIRKIVGENIVRVLRARLK